MSTVEEHNLRIKRQVEARHASVRKVFEVAQQHCPGELRHMLEEFAAFCQAYYHEAVQDGFDRDVYQGRRSAFFWLLHHGRLARAEELFPLYLQTEEPEQDAE